MKRISGFLLLLAGTLQAQVAVVTSPQGTQRAAQESTVISVRFDDVRLSDAVQTIAEKAAVVGTTVTFSPARVPLKWISYRGENVSVETALAAVLKGSQMRLERLGNGNLKVVPVQIVVVKAQGVINGRIVDAKSGKGIPGVNVSLDNGSRGVMSSEDGTYRLAGISAGNHTVSVRFVGYAKQTRIVVVGEGTTVAVDFKLDASANVLDQVIVTGTIIQTELKAIPNAITVITAKDIEERGIARIDQLFRGDVPGLFSMNRGSEALLDEVTMFSRGATALIDPFTGVSPSAGTNNGTNPIKTFIDGVEMADSKYLSQIDPKTIERIEILAGPQASTIYGSNAINGVMQIFTKRGTTAQSQWDINISNGLTQNNSNNHLAPTRQAAVQVSGIEGRWSYNAGGGWDYLGAWTPSKQTQRLGANAAGRLTLGALATDLSARKSITRNRQAGSQGQVFTDLRATGIYRPSPDVADFRRSTLNGNTFGLGLTYNPFSWWSHEVVLGSDNADVEAQKIIPGYAARTDTLLAISSSSMLRSSERYTSTVQFPLATHSRINLTAGADHWRTRGSVWSASPLSLTGTIAGANVVRNRPGKNSGAFLQGQLALNDVLFFTYGLRAEWNPNFGDNAKVRPGRYGLSYARSMGPISAKIRGSYGQSIRPPAENQKTALTVNPTSSNGAALVGLFGVFDERLANSDLGPEHQSGGEGGVEMYFGNRGSIVLTRYNQTVDNLISAIGGFINGIDSVRSINLATTDNIFFCNSLANVGDYCYRWQSQYLNVGSIRNQGWELQGDVNTGPFTTRGTYSWTKSRVLGVTPKYRALLAHVNFQAGRPFDYLPEHTWALGITYARSYASISLGLNGIGALYRNIDDLYFITDSNNRLRSFGPRFNTPDFYRPVGAGYTMADINATYHVSQSVDAIVKVQNLTNYYQNDFSASYVSIGRQSKAGIRVHF